MKHGIGRTLAGGFFPVENSLSLIFGNTLSHIVEHAEAELGRAVAGGGKRRQQLGGLFRLSGIDGLDCVGERVGKRGVRECERQCEDKIAYPHIQFDGLFSVVWLMIGQEPLRGWNSPIRVLSGWSKNQAVFCGRLEK
ncbi:hypothetical protein [uncultured Dechloromonas sp.]|uniref:hypothetical protein n=1 Tax=uncultured Dechloromonas sp. TaxID=171719 RepID=UPI0025F0ED40|nr:hypothetical protein [uncultured Dechloromonas sp.]